MKHNKSRYEPLEVYYDPTNPQENNDHLFKLMEMILPRSDIVKIIEKEKQKSDYQSINVDVPKPNPFDDDPYIEIESLADVHAELGAINVQLD